MILLINIIFITTIWVIGIKIVTADEMVLSKVGKWGEKKVEDGRKIFEALLVCPFCMPSVHSLIGFAFAFALGIIDFEFSWKYIISYPIVVMGASALSGFTWNLYLTMNQIKNYFKYLNGEDK